MSVVTQYPGDTVGLAEVGEGEGAQLRAVDSSFAPQVDRRLPGLAARRIEQSPDAWVFRIARQEGLVR